MPKKVEGRNPKARVAQKDRLIEEITEMAERPTLAELRDRLHQREPVLAKIDTARLVREGRERK